MRPVLILTAVPREAKLLIESLGSAAAPQAIGAFACSQGRLGKLPVAVCAAGVGKINAASAAAVMIGHLRPRLVINTGCGGAYPGSGLSVGDLAVASAEVLGDEGALTPAGWLDLQQMNLPSLVNGKHAYFNEVPLSAHAAEAARALAGRQGLRLSCGRFITVSTCSGTVQRGEELSRRFDGICENMEGAAIALTCLRYGVDCLEIRGISNLVEERDLKQWDIPAAVQAAQEFVLRYLEEMSG